MTTTQKNSGLFDMPPRVISTLLTFVDPPTFLTLRLTSKDTKSWIDTDHLHYLTLYVKDEERLKVILESKVEWVNVIFPPHLCNIKGIPFLQRFSASLRTIKIQRHECDKATFSTEGLYKFLLNTSPGLKLFDVSEDLELWFLTAMLQLKC